MKQVTVYQTRGAKQVVVNTNAENWGDLKKDLIKAGVDYSRMKVFVMETKAVLELDGAVLPKGLDINGTITDNFSIYLSVARQKAGVNFAK